MGVIINGAVIVICGILGLRLAGGDSSSDPPAGDAGDCPMCLSDRNRWSARWTGNNRDDLIHGFWGHDWRMD